MSRQAPRATDGLATLPILLLLLMLTLLAAAWTQRSVLNEIRSSSLQLQHAIAFEAAEAGLAFTQALLNSGRTVGDDCRPSDAGTAATFFNRFLAFEPAADGGEDVELQLRDRGAAATTPALVCLRAASDWRCACPTDSAAGLSADADAQAAAPSFSVRLQRGAAPSMLEVLVAGCSDAARPCMPGASGRADASALVRQTLVLLPAIATPPAAALTVRGNVSAPSGAAFSVINRDAASGGLALHAGGTIDAPALRSASVAGAVQAGERIGGDTALAALSPGQLFQRHFGPSPDQWQRQPGVVRFTCGAAADCSARLRERIDHEAGVARLAVDGELRLPGPMQLGTPARPVMLVIEGDLRIDGAVVIHGLVHARNLHWSAAADDGSARLTGAAMVSGSFSTDSAPLFTFDPALVARLRTRTGSWVRLPGSWRDEG